MILALTFAMGRKLVIKNSSGTSAIVYALCLLPLSIMVGGAIDLNAQRSTESSLQHALDATALATARQNLKNDVAKKAFATDYLKDNFRQNGLAGPIELTAKTENSVLRVTAKGEIDTSLMALAGVDTLAVGAVAAVAEGVEAQRTEPLEFIFVMDMSNSMNFGDGTFQQAKDLVSETFRTLEMSATDTAYVDMALIPISDRVNVGTDRADLLSGPAPANWQGCVEPRYSSSYSSFKAVHDPEDPFYAGDTDDDDDDDHDDDDDNKKTSKTSGEFYKTHLLTDHKPNSDKRRFQASIPSVTGGISQKGPGYPQCGSAIYGPTQEADEMISALQAISTKGTGRYDLALAWAWRMVSPDWQNYIGHKKYPAKHKDVEKAVAIVTDGNSTAYTWEAGGADGDQEGFIWNQVTDDGFGLIEATCERIKKDDVKVYVIMVNTYERAIEPFRRCATSDDHFFETSTIEEFQAAVYKLAGTSRSLRLIE